MRYLGTFGKVRYLTRHYLALEQLSLRNRGVETDSDLAQATLWRVMWRPDVPGGADWACHQKYDADMVHIDRKKNFHWTLTLCSGTPFAPKILCCEICHCAFSPERKLHSRLDVDLADFYRVAQTARR